jgi:eukaryotic-like serine/threonine-protein kinase
MSPEQIEGKEADARSDIFSLGAVLYEMATGKRAFQGKSHLSTASSILEKDPDPISIVQPLAPKALEHTVQTCLAKDPEERFQNAHDLKFQLQWLAGAGAESPVTGSAFKARSPKTLWAAWAIAALAVVVSGLLWVLRDAGTALVLPSPVFRSPRLGTRRLKPIQAPPSQSHLTVSVWRM